MGPVAPKFTRQTDKEGEFAEGVASRPPKRLHAEEYMGEGRDRGGSESPEPVHQDRPKSSRPYVPARRGVSGSNCACCSGAVVTGPGINVVSPVVDTSMFH